VISIINSYILAPQIDTSTVALLHCDGTNGSTSFPDSALGGNAPHTVAAQNAAQVSTAQSEFGGASCVLANAADHLLITDDSDFDLGSADFTIEGWVRFNSVPATTKIIYEQYVTNPTTTVIQLFLSSGSLVFYSQEDGVGVVAHYTAPWSPSVDTWYHFACVRSGTSITFFIDGTSLSMTEVDAIGSDALPNCSSPIALGGRDDDTLSVLGYLDEVRISLAARYTTTFTPSGPFTPYQ